MPVTIGPRRGAVSLGAIRKILFDLLREELRAAIGKNSADTIPRELIIRYVVGAYIAVMSCWLDGGVKVAPCANGCDVSTLGDRGRPGRVLLSRSINAVLAPISETSSH